MLVTAQHGLTETSGRFRMACDVAPGPNVRVHRTVFQVQKTTAGMNPQVVSTRRLGGAVEACGRGHV